MYFRRLVEGEKPLDEALTASIKAAGDASRAEATAEALQSKPSLLETAAKFWDKSSHVSSNTKEFPETIAKDQKSDGPSK